MAYCKKCGAYIPDGLSACLACGYDEAAEESRSGAAAAREQQNEDFRLKYEEERRRRQEDNRKWAEQERQRRLEEEERRRREEEERQQREAEERARRQAEQESRARAYTYRAASAASPQGKNRILSALSYLSILWILPRFLCKEDAFARFHARQGLVLFVFSIICDAISAAVPIGGLLNLFRIYCIYKGMSNALNDRMEPLPYIGQFAERDS